METLERMRQSCLRLRWKLRQWRNGAGEGWPMIRRSRGFRGRGSHGCQLLGALAISNVVFGFVCKSVMYVSLGKHWIWKWKIFSQKIINVREKGKTSLEWQQEALLRAK
jgi:hypothetical protein